jgi:hypothetical protein
MIAATSLKRTKRRGEASKLVVCGGLEAGPSLIHVLPGANV